LPPLVDKSLSRGWKVVLQFAGEETRDLIDNQLWTWREASFLPHATDGGEFDARQPVLLTTGDANANDANVRFLCGGAELESPEGYERIVVMFDGHDNEQLERARGQWRRFSGIGHQLTYWQQAGEGRWERKA
jgi:DNA polymerase III subunit chi